MSCIVHMDRVILPNDIVVQIAKIYKYIGKNESYKEIIQTDMERIIMQTIERDTFFLSQILKLELTDARMRLIITKDSLPRKKEETTVYNLKEMLITLQKNYHKTEYTSTDLLNMINYVFSHYNAIKYEGNTQVKKTSINHSAPLTARAHLEMMIEELNRYIDKEVYEKISLYLHFFIDFDNLAPFTSNNDVAAFLLLYLLLLKADVEAFRFVSFFEILFTNFSKFQEELMKASLNWKEGFSQTLGFVRVMNDIILEAYEKLDEIIETYQYDQAMNKADNLENTILMFESAFTKEDIRLLHPYVSESTINRALKKLRDEKKIKPIGKGRSAKWVNKKMGHNA